MIMRIHAGKDTGATGAAGRCGDVRFFKRDSLVEYFSLSDGHKRAHGVIALIVGDNDEKIGRRILCEGRINKDRARRGQEGCA